MRLYLKIIEGPNKGEKHSLTKDTSFGRKGADVELADVKLSGVHAFFKFSKASGWQVVDNQSRNGLWINGHKEPRADLKDGDLVQMGGTQMRVRIPETGAFHLSKKFLAWFREVYKKMPNKKVELQEINPEIRLRVIQGIQSGESWEIFYGPRVAGRDHYDICLHDEKALRETFEIRVKGKYAYFFTNDESMVMINEKKMKEKQLIPGDVISFGQTKILVEVEA
jgi:pSer/pThr/pTyr-binding forkhead associated (FHA) protein